MTNETTNSLVKRRTVLEGATATVALAATGVGHVQASDRSGTNVGTAAFVRAGLECSIAEDDDSGAYPTDLREIAPSYEVDPAGRTLSLLPYAAPSERTRARNGDALVQFGSLRDAPVTRFESGVDRLPVVLDHSFQERRLLHLAESVTLPSIAVSVDDGDATVEVDDTAETLAAGESEQLTLDSLTATTEVERVTDEIVDTPGVPERLRPRRVETTETEISVEPTLTVENLGELDIVDLTEDRR